jgi:hypothetical protein
VSQFNSSQLRIPLDAGAARIARQRSRPIYGIGRVAVVTLGRGLSAVRPKPFIAYQLTRDGLRYRLCEKNARVINLSLNPLPTRIR